MPRKANLDRSAVVQTAAELIDREGIENLTLALLADKLSIRTPSLYNHISGMTELRHELALYSKREMLARFTRATVGKAGDDAIVSLATTYRTYAKEHPGIYRLSQYPPAANDSESQALAQEIIEIMLEILASYRLSQEDALHAVRGLRSIVDGFVSLEITGGFGMPLDLDQSFARLLRIFIDGLKNLSNTC